MVDKFFYQPQAIKPQVEEKLVAELRPPKKIVAPWLLFGLIIPFLGWFLILPLALWSLIVVSKTRYTVTNIRVSIGRKIFRDNKNQIPISQIASVAGHRGIWARMFGYGEVWVMPTSGRRPLLLKVSNSDKVIQLLESLTPRSGMDVPRIG